LIFEKNPRLGATAGGRMPPADDGPGGAGVVSQAARHSSAGHAASDISRTTEHRAAPSAGTPRSRIESGAKFIVMSGE
jgi:hypothetical protein